MKIIQVIHGYPMRYNAGSEVYTQTLCHALAARHDLRVFTREEDSFAPDFAMRAETDPDDQRVRLHVVNVPRSKDRYQHVSVDQRFAELIEKFAPDVVHVGHLNHLSTSLVTVAAARGIPIVFTLHDYWLMCSRGQFMQMHPENPENLWAACDGQEDRKCAERCYARYFSGAREEAERDITAWQAWVERRMRHVREIVEQVDQFIAPSRYLMERFKTEFGLPPQKVRYVDYGFDLNRLKGRLRTTGEPFTFGYIGTHIPAKGIHLLIEAFGQLRGNHRLRIWGRHRGQDSEALRALAERLPNGAGARVEWLDEYANRQIVSKVFNHVDAIVAPSIWVENSPLVIHEALQARIPVITADTGGMAEYVGHEANGLLFAFRDAASLASQMQRLADNPALAKRLGNRGYLQSASGDVPSIEEHAREIETIYDYVIRRRKSARVSSGPGPWRITFDTNPDTCNVQCVMCEEHSPLSTLQAQRRAAGKPLRLMPVEWIERIIAEAAPNGLREVIPSTMGEPLLFDGFEQIVESCVRHNVKLNVTTNGTFPRRGASGWATLLVPVTSDIKVSINGATAQTQASIMQGAPLDQVLANVKEFIAVRDEHFHGGGNFCRVTFQLTFLETNIAEIPALVRLAIELGADRVKGHHLWAHFDEVKALSMRRSPEAIKRWNETVLACREIVSERRLTNGKPLLLENFFLLDANATDDLAPGGICPFLGQEAWVSAKGRFNPCCAPDAQRKTLGEFGNVSEQGLIAIWNGQPYRELLASYRNRSLCLGCNMRKPVEAP
ncbi:MAG: glycosyltransferase [Planctomycetes bacterium]|nr:glycosyltransferase [Planctomycetota bacterium]